MVRQRRRGELAHHALDDRYEGGAKSGARCQSALAEIDEEIHALCDALVTSEGNLGL
jgi:hypothetical protein